MNPTKEEKASKEPSEEVSDELAKYELMMILRPDMSQEETEKELKKVKKLLKDHKAEIYHEDIWDVRDLAYVIKKNDKGYYVIYYFTIEGKELVEIEKELQLNAKIFRHLVVKSPKNYEIKKLEELMAPSTERRGKPQEDKQKRTPRKITKKAEEQSEPKESSKEEKVEEKPEPEEVTEEKPEQKSQEKTPEKTEEKAEASKKTMDISDLDSKLESILDDPDIDIKI